MDNSSKWYRCYLKLTLNADDVSINTCSKSNKTVKHNKRYFISFKKKRLVQNIYMVE